MTDDAKKTDPNSFLYDAEFAMAKSNISKLSEVWAQALDGKCFSEMPERWIARALDAMGAASRESLEWLKAHGVDFKQDDYARILVKIAADKNNSDAIEFLGAEGSTGSSLGVEGLIALAIACHSRKPAACKALLSLGVDPNALGKDMTAPLILAVTSRSRNWDEDKLVAALLEAGARPDPENQSGPCPLALSLKLEEPGAFKMLLAATLAMPFGDARQRLLDEALCAACSLLSGQGPHLDDDYPKDRLPIAISILMEHGANPIAWVRELGCSPRPTTAFVCSVGGGRLDPEFKAFSLLLKDGASPVESGGKYSGITALHVAAGGLPKEKLSKFLELWPATLDALDERGANAAMHAAQYNHCAESIELMASLCDPNALDADGKSFVDHLDSSRYGFKGEERAKILEAHAGALRRVLATVSVEPAATRVALRV